MLSREVITQVKLVQKEQPGLEYIPEKGYLSGRLKIEEGDEYSVDIDLNSFPYRFPIVWETGERIPRRIDRHINNKIESCCFTTSAMEQILLKTKVKSLLQFINLIAIPYFLNNSYFEINKKYKNGDYSHGILGKIEGYGDILELDDKKIIVLALMMRLSQRNYNRNDICFCGKVNIENCHFINYNNLFLIDHRTIIDDLKDYFQYLKIRA